MRFRIQYVGIIVIEAETEEEARRKFYTYVPEAFLPDFEIVKVEEVDA